MTSVTDSPLTVVADGYRLNCDRVVIATHNPIVGKAGVLNATLLQTKLALYSSYAVAAHVAKGQVADALFWDTADPYSSYGSSPENATTTRDLRRRGPQDRPGAMTRRRLTALEQALRRSARRRGAAPLVGSGDRDNDGLPYIGETAQHQFAATGFSGNGMTFGTVAAMMAGRGPGRENPWQELFDIGRTKIAGGLWDYIKENMDYPYYLIRDRSPAEGESLARSLKRGEGKILEARGQRVAVYRHDEGKVTLRSATCTHMGCLVHWNNAEPRGIARATGRDSRPRAKSSPVPRKRLWPKLRSNSPVPNRR